MRVMSVTHRRSVRRREGDVRPDEGFEDSYSISSIRQGDVKQLSEPSWTQHSIINELQSVRCIHDDE